MLGRSFFFLFARTTRREVIAASPTDITADISLLSPLTLISRSRSGIFLCTQIVVLYVSSFDYVYAVNRELGD